ncbi:hypothetical protein EXO78_06210 [Salmonella enterica]|nr:hypothetical protein [Salmonella enterica]
MNSCNCSAAKCIHQDDHTTGSVITPTIAPPEQVEVLIGYLRDRISTLESQINDLAGRLRPVLIDAEPVPTAEEKAPVLLSPLALELWYENGRLRALSVQITDIQNLLTV